MSSIRNQVAIIEHHDEGEVAHHRDCEIAVRLEAEEEVGTWTATTAKKARDAGIPQCEVCGGPPRDKAAR